MALAALLGAACSRYANDYSAFAAVDPDGWDYGNTLVFMPTTEDSLVEGTLALMVHHSDSYPYRNLYLEVSAQQLTPDSNITYRTDTINVVLADVYGNWLGSGVGTSFRLSQPINSNYRLLSKAPVRVRHIMRAETVPGLEQIGIIFTHHGN